jgi:hypothetical protein
LKCSEDIERIRKIEKPKIKVQKCEEIKETEEAIQTYRDLNEHDKKIFDEEISQL